MYLWHQSSWSTELNAPLVRLIKRQQFHIRHTSFKYTDKLLIPWMYLGLREYGNERVYIRNWRVRVGYLSMTSNEFAANIATKNWSIHFFRLQFLFECWFSLVTLVNIWLIITCCIRGIVRFASILGCFFFQCGKHTISNWFMCIFSNIKKNCS